MKLNEGKVKSCAEGGTVSSVCILVHTVQADALENSSAVKAYGMQGDEEAAVCTFRKKKKRS